MNRWIKQIDVEDKASLERDVRLENSKKQYRNYHQSHQYQQHRSPYLSLIKPNIKNGGSPRKADQGPTSISAQKSLIIRNMMLSPLASRQHLPKIINALEKHISLNKNEEYVRNLHEDKRKQGWKQRQKKRFRIKQSYRMKTEQISINLLQKEQRQQLNNQTRLKNQQNSHERIERLSKQISKSIALSDLLISQKQHKLKTSNHSEEQTKQSLLLQNQSKFLRINKVSRKDRLYQTQTAKDQHQQLCTSAKGSGKKRTIISSK